MAKRLLDQKSLRPGRAG